MLPRIGSRAAAKIGGQFDDVSKRKELAAGSSLYNIRRIVEAVVTHYDDHDDDLNATSMGDQHSPTQPDISPASTSAT
jgi:hypothetical protein